MCSNNVPIFSILQLSMFVGGLNIIAAGNMSNMQLILQHVQEVVAFKVHDWITAFMLIIALHMLQTDQWGRI